MCGLTGFFVAQPLFSGEQARVVLRPMANAIMHRGPDSAGYWSDPATGIALGHRRLAILDLSPAGHQPMTSAQGRFVIVFNGEIYNHGEIRKELEGAGAAPVWRGHSDTETILAAFEAWGIGPSLKRFVGMFAFALWDREERTLTLARDRMGEKPLYYGYSGKTLLFGSELKGLKAFPGFSAPLDRAAITLLLKFNYIPVPNSIYEGIRKLQPGCWLQFTQEDVAVGRFPTPEAYWSVEEAIGRGQREPFAGSDVEAVDQLERLLSQAVAGQMLADVPLGAFLSGGIDSSTIVALMQRQSARPVKTFSIGFHEPGYNEADHAKAVARHLGTDHAELYVTAEQALAVIPKLPSLYDEPFADVSQIPTFLVSELARRHVTVSLSGDGGDELFGGYTRYSLAEQVWRIRSAMPAWGRRLAGVGLRTVSASTWNRLFSGPMRLVPQRFQMSNIGDKMHKLAELLAVSDRESLYSQFVTFWPNPSAMVVNGVEQPTPLTNRVGWPAVADYAHRMMHLDQITYLPDDILAKVDRAAMGVSLETRVPFLDHRVVEFAWRMPTSLKLRGQGGKWGLRQALYRHVPRELVERPKMGFGIPIDSWLRGPLREWAEALLDEKRLRREGVFHPKPIRERWDGFLSGRMHGQYHLWGVLMFQAWLEEVG